MCRWPDVFRAAICMSGTYDLARFVQRPRWTDDFYDSHRSTSCRPSTGGMLDSCVPASSCSPRGGREEDLGEPGRCANELGAKGIPNRVD